MLLYRNLDIKCKFKECEKYVKLIDLEKHENICNKKKCLNYGICKNEADDVFYFL